MTPVDLRHEVPRPGLRGQLRGKLRGKPSLARRVTIAAAALVALQLSAVAQGPPPGFPGGPGAGFPGIQGTRELVAQFDKNGDKRLNAVERKAAREWLGQQPAGFPGFGGRGGFGAPAAASVAGRTLAPADVREYPGVALYDAGTLRTLFLTFESSDWEQELAAFNNTDVEVPASVRVDGRTYADVGVHFRGLSSFMMVPEGRKRSLNLSFDFVNDKQDLYGYRTLNLLNAAGDPTFLRAVLYTEIASHYMPTPKMNYLRVAINGESWGIYVNTQQFNKEFLRDFYGTTKGARWKVPGSPGGRGGLNFISDNVADYKSIYEITSKDEPQPWKDLINLTRVLTQTPPETLEAALAPILDVDETLKFLALEVALVNSDGYWMRASDYSIYQDPKGRFHILPHDVNEGLDAEEGPPGGRGRGGPPAGPQGFAVPLNLPPGFALPPDFSPPQGFPQGGPGGPGGRGRGGFGMFGGGPDLDPLVGLDDTSKPLRSKLLAVPALRAKYLAYVRDIAEHWLDWKTLGPIAQKYHDLIAADVKADVRKIYTSEEFDAGMNGVKAFMDERRSFLLKPAGAAK